MSENESETKDSIETRTRRALEECMTVLPNKGRAQGAPGLFVVIGENENGQYLVDSQTGSCECKDAQYRDPEGGCKHIRRVRIAQGETPETPVPAGALDEITVDSTFGVHVDASPKFATADGGILDGETGEEISDETESTTTWSDPKVEVDKYGKPTGDHYVTCQECGVEVLTALSDCATHREGCSE
jgi:predicted nucleic acid-binding Zn finger protein